MKCMFSDFTTIYIFNQKKNYNLKQGKKLVTNRLDIIKCDMQI